MGNASIVFQPLQQVFREIDVPFVDMPEVIELIRGFFKTVDFFYYAGDPPAPLFDLEWYLTEADAERNVDQLTEYLPIYELTPTVPFQSLRALGDHIRKGEATFYVPPDWIYDRVYGKIILRQETPEPTLEPIGDPKRAPVSPFERRRQRLHDPQWENK